MTEDKEGFECFKSKSCEDQIDQLFKIIKKLEKQNKELDMYRGHLEKRVVTELMLKYSEEYRGKTDAEKRKLSGVINQKFFDAIFTESIRNLSSESIDSQSKEVDENPDASSCSYSMTESEGSMSIPQSAFKA